LEGGGGWTEQWIVTLRLASKT